MSDKKDKKRSGAPISTGAYPPRLGIMWAPDASVSETKKYSPSMDIYENEDHVVIEVELPGVNKSSIEVYVEHDAIVVEGLKNEISITGQTAGERVSYLQFERKFGRFGRKIELPVPCDTNDVTAAYQNGVLTVKVKKIKDRRGRRRRIEVQ